jgi:hypothetical protein
MGSAILVFTIWQSLVWLIFRCKKQRKQQGAAEGDLFAKGQSGMLPAPPGGSTVEPFLCQIR